MGPWLPTLAAWLAEQHPTPTHSPGEAGSWGLGSSLVDKSTPGTGMGSAIHAEQSKEKVDGLKAGLL